MSAQGGQSAPAPSPAPGGGSGGTPKGTTATLGGVALLGVASVGWTLRPGVTPSQRVFIVSPEEAKALLATSGRPIDLVLQANTGDKITVKGLFVLGETVSDSPNHRAILVSDRRWRWGRSIVRRSYNVRRATGNQRLISGSLVPFQFSAEIKYAAWSTRDGAGTAWGAVDILGDVISVIDPDAVTAYQTNLGSRADLRNEDVVLDDPGDEALARALGYCPGVGVTLDANDQVVFYDQTGGGEGDLFKSLGDPIVGGGMSAFVDVPLLRPMAIDVLFDQQIEARFDYVEGSNSEVVLPDSPQLWDVNNGNLENVLPSPDPTFALAAGGTVGMLTWITFDEFFAGLPGNAAAKGIPNFGADLNADTVQKSFVNQSGWDIYAGIGIGTTLASQLWPSRLAAVNEHYRQTFRIPHELWDRFLNVQAIRVSILRETDDRAYANAQVFSNFAYAPPLRAFIVSSSGPSIRRKNISNWAAASSECKISPASVTILDDQAGIFRVDYVIPRSSGGKGADILPCQVRDERGVDPGDFSTFQITDLDELTRQHKLAVILTVTPAAPNDQRQLYSLRVTPDEAQPLLAQPIGTCGGPTLQVRVSSADIAARFAWVDAQAARISEKLGLDTSDGTPDDSQDPIDPINRDDLDFVARAFAASIWAQYAPRHEGTRAGPLAASATIVGRATAVDHSILPDGRARTTVSAAPLPPFVDPFSRLPDSVRQVVRRLVRKGSA